MTRLWERMATECVRMLPTRLSDGEGGSHTVWADDGSPFGAAIVRNSSAVERVAEAGGEAAGYTVTSNASVEFGGVFRRLSDGACFRVTSHAADVAAPAPASFSFHQFQAVRWEVPDHG